MSDLPHFPPAGYTSDEWLMRQCLDALNAEATASEDFRIRAEKCSSWFRLRADLRARLRRQLEKGGTCRA